MNVLTILFAAAFLLTLVLLIRSLFRQAGIEDAIKETSDQAHDQLKLWEEFGQHLDEGVGLLDEHGTFVYVNEVFAELTGHPHRSAVGQTVEQIVTLQDAGAQPAELPSGTTGKLLYVLSAEGRRTPAYVARRKLHKPEGYAMVVLRDASAENAEKEIRQRLVKLSSFELRAPITAMKGYASMLLDGDAGAIPKSARQYLEPILQSTDKLLTIIDDMANVEALSTKKAPAKKTSVGSTEFLRGIHDKLADVAKEADRNFHLTEGALDLPLSIDKEHVGRLLSMLVNTAARTAKQGSEVTLTVTQGPRTANFEIINQGSPLPKESQANVFDYVGGAGLDEGIGFYVAKQIIEEHQAYVTVNTKPDGNVFILSLPLAEQDESKKSAAPSAAQPDDTRPAAPPAAKAVAKDVKPKGKPSS